VLDVATGIKIEHILYVVSQKAFDDFRREPEYSLVRRAVVTVFPVGHIFGDSTSMVIRGLLWTRMQDVLWENSDRVVLARIA
jgi:hypothetical protein